MMLRDIRSHQMRDLRSQMLQEIASGKGRRKVLGESTLEEDSSRQGGSAAERGAKRGSLKPGACNALPGERAHAKRGSIEPAREKRRHSNDVKEQHIGFGGRTAAGMGSMSPQKGAGARLSGAL